MAGLKSFINRTPITLSDLGEHPITRNAALLSHAPLCTGRSSFQPDERLSDELLHVEYDMVRLTRVRERRGCIDREKNLLLESSRCELFQGPMCSLVKERVVGTEIGFQGTVH